MVLFFNIAGAKVENNIDSSQFKVLIFTSETCPICQQMTPNLRSVIEKYKSENVNFELIFPNPGYSTQITVSEYKSKYKLDCASYIDSGRKLTKKYEIKITPEIIFVDQINNRILYRGKLDNQYEGLGKRRQIITEHYLDDALSQALKGQEVKMQFTEPIGCFIANE
jgi:thiol-disulfide isomerase/thioredoxin